jgi:type IV secretion system protein VirD4
MGPDQSPTTGQQPSGGGGGFEMIVVAVGGFILTTVGVIYAGAALAAKLVGGHVSGGISDLFGVAGRLAQHPGDPGAAWGELASGLPGAGLYWACTIILVVAAIALVVGAVWLWKRWASPGRERLGVSTEARIARASDVKPLMVGSSIPPSGRMLLGRFAPHGSMLATEDRERNPAKGRRAESRQGDRGSVALIGPTRAGKTVLAAAGIIAWDGPVIALSVKRDLYDATAAARAKRGDIAVFDPSGVTGLPTARWTPLRAITTTSGAARAGRALAQAIPTNGVTGGDFWKSHGETLTSAYMSLAGLSMLLPASDKAKTRPPLTVGRLASWAFLHVGVTDPTVNELIRLGLEDDRPLEVRLLAKDAMTKLMAFEGEDPRIRASIYATARLAFEAWNEPAIAHSASLDPRAFYHCDEIWKQEPRYIDLDWLMGGPKGKPRTLYLCAPSTEFDRLAPVLGGMLGDLREQIHSWDIGGRKLNQPLMILIDEAGQLELRWFPEEVSTIAGLGGMFVTGWQSKSQITARYGTLADAVLSGHRSKVIFNGTDDPATLDYVARIAGTVHVTQRGWSADTSMGRKTISEQPQREDLLPPHVVRQMRRNDAVLFHGTLPPIHLRLVRWWKDKDLRALVPHGEDGKPLPAPKTGTCPVWPTRKSQVEPVIDPAVIAEQLASMPKPKPALDRTSATAVAAVARPGTTPPGKDSGQGKLDFAATSRAGDDPGGPNRVAGNCESCRIWIPVGAGRLQLFGQRTLLLCKAPCQPAARPTTPSPVANQP